MNTDPVVFPDRITEMCYRVGVFLPYCKSCIHLWPTNAERDQWECKVATRLIRHGHGRFWNPEWSACGQWSSYNENEV